jgi:hypothetical protein
MKPVCEPANCQTNCYKDALYALAADSNFFFFLLLLSHLPNKVGLRFLVFLKKLTHIKKKTPQIRRRGARATGRGKEWAYTRKRLRSVPRGWYGPRIIRYVAWIINHIVAKKMVVFGSTTPRCSTAHHRAFSSPPTSCGGSFSTQVSPF